MCGEPGEELCDICFTHIHILGTEDYELCDGCKERVNKTCLECGVEQEETLGDGGGFCAQCEEECG